jgi:wyosine [tRNA(Phe)-imidazoG37] synthetase (radical SAM superfamily)
MKGVPGVLQEKLDEGMNVKHCALSLVGEPIMYPEINKYVRIEIRYKDFKLLYLVLYEELYKDKKYIAKTI